MYEPELQGITNRADSVLVLLDGERRVGTYRGESRGESYEIHLIDPWTDEVDKVSFFHKEDLYKNTKENMERLKLLVQ